MQEWFKDWFNSPYYHKLYIDRNDSEAEAFITKLIGHLKPAARSRILDLACGKGRHALQLSKNGFDVTGIDLSDESILAAKAFETDDLHFFVHDMRYSCRINYYDYIFNFFTSFGYFDTERENQAVLRSIAESLKPGGTFLIDYLNESFAIDTLQANTVKEIDGITFNIKRYITATHICKEIQIIDPSNPGSITYGEKVARFRKQHLTEMLSEQGLKAEEIWGDYELSPFDENKSPRLIIKAIKV